jgi:hypothetical protein
LNSEIKDWILSIIDRPNVAALNIGLMESTDGYRAYLVGSNVYDEKNDDWACNEDYTPKQKYLSLPNTKGMDWISVQNAVVSAVKDTLIVGNSILSHVQNVTVGFDDADLVKVK